VKTKLLNLAELPPDIFSLTSYAEKPAAGFVGFGETLSGKKFRP
jgi:hypothetical protein